MEIARIAETITTPIRTGGTWSLLNEFFCVNCGLGISAELVICTRMLIIDASDGVPLSLACIKNSVVKV